MEEFKRSLKSNLPLIAILTSIGYLMCYYYQLSIANYYGYPEEYIAFDLNTLLKTCALFFLLALVTLGPISLSPSHTKKLWILLIFEAVLLLIYLSVFSVVNPFSFFSNTKAISLTIIMGYAIIPVLSFYIILSYFEGVRFPKSGISIVITASFLIYSIPNAIGAFSSYAKSQYFQLAKNEQFILLSSSGNRLIFGSCNESGVKFLLKNDSTSEILIPVKTKEQVTKIRDCFFNRDFK